MSRARTCIVGGLVLVMIVMAVGCSQTKTGTKETAEVKKVETQQGLAAGVEATVNGEEITISMVDAEVKRIEAQNKTPENIAAYEAQKQAIRSQILDLLIEGILYSQQAEEFKISVTDAEVEADMAASKAKFKDEAEFNNALAEAAMTLEDFRVYKRKTLISAKVNAYVIANNLVTSADVAAYAAAHPNTNTELIQQQIDEANLIGAWMEKVKAKAIINKTK